MKFSKTSLVVIIYILGVILGAFFLDIWGAETSMKKGFIAPKISFCTAFLHYSIGNMSVSNK